MTLKKPSLHMECCVTLDNYYSCRIFTDTLVKYKADTYGTIKLNRKYVHIDVKTKKLKKGETIAFRRGKAVILKWKDKKYVTLISTIHNSDMSKVKSKAEEKLKPKVVIGYNDSLGDANHADQIWHGLPYQENMRKSITRKI